MWIWKSVAFGILQNRVFNYCKIVFRVPKVPYQSWFIPHQLEVNQRRGRGGRAVRRGTFGGNQSRRNVPKPVRSSSKYEFRIISILSASQNEGVAVLLPIITHVYRTISILNLPKMRVLLSRCQ